MPSHAAAARPTLRGDHAAAEVWRSRALAAVLAATAAALVVLGPQLRVAEAGLQTLVLRALGQSARHLGTASIFTVDGRSTGLSFTPGCSVGPVLALFLGATAVAAFVRPLRTRPVVVSALVLVGLFVVVNQLRAGVIVASMRWWGVENGYDVSHVFLGSIISTVGFLLALVLVVRLLLGAGPGRRP
ncbi:hypothetical protein GCM10027047_25310 [Rhodococcus aerolatus]